MKHWTYRAGLTLWLVAFIALAIACDGDPKAAGDAAKGESQDAPQAVAGLKAPKLQIDNASHDFGEVPRGDSPTHTFILRNVGTDVLHIKRAKGS